MRSHPDVECPGFPSVLDQDRDRWVSRDPISHPQAKGEGQAVHFSGMVTKQVVKPTQPQGGETQGTQSPSLVHGAQECQAMHQPFLPPISTNHRPTLPCNKSSLRDQGSPRTAVWRKVTASHTVIT